MGRWGEIDTAVRRGVRTKGKVVGECHVVFDASVARVVHAGMIVVVPIERVTIVRTSEFREELKKCIN